ncbi:hypothetical protein CC78DRAFT_535702 [Lojkania enalia]|uniref:Calcineurin-like phosphoesterase domain-containing protein n=1 Tax=Lojkania enalia TaxID=147567 RepID=A0A9P4K3V6_9PLEO|nr:hypothetical protein CC78DRAFT_535702 [Didymosphaeria enalia]
MQLSRFFFSVALLLFPLCLIATTWLYSYPPLHGCNFPHASPNSSAPFRLLALGDPQLEGDSSLPKPGAHVFPSLEFLVRNVRKAGTWKRRWYFLKGAARDALTKDLPKWGKGVRKRIDLWGNDLYLAHIVRCTRWWTRPTHVAVLGDLLGSQWIGDEEFERRAGRYWDTVFRGMEKVPEEIMGGVEDEGDRGLWGSTTEVLGHNKSWENRVINIAGNHDIGYAGDLDEGRIRRFEKAFGKVNWDIAFELPHEPNSANDSKPPALRLVVLNSMNLDTPALSEPLQQSTYSFLNHIISTSRPVTSRTHATILLTHIPLHKTPGICYDSPFFSFFHTGSGIQEQNMLSEHGSKTILEGIFGLSSNPHAEGQGLGRHGIIINGHDHEGCDVIHYIPQSEEYQPSCVDPIEPVEASTDHPVDGSNSPIPYEAKWGAFRLPVSPSRPEKPVYPLAKVIPCTLGEETPAIREITLRSMMGDFSGYAGFLSAWFDEDKGEEGEWRLEFTTCGVGIQHWWWGVHIMNLILLVFLGMGVIVRLLEWSQVDNRQGVKGNRAVEPRVVPDSSTLKTKNTINCSVDKEMGKR